MANFSLEKYKRLNGKYLEDGEKLLQSGDLLQAGEKFWGAAAEIVKAVAAKEGRHLRTHNQIWSYLLDLDEKHSGLGLRRDFVSAGYLHANFYEEELTPRTVRKLVMTSGASSRRCRDFSDGAQPILSVSGCAPCLDFSIRRSDAPSS